MKKMFKKKVEEEAVEEIKVKEAEPVKAGVEKPKDENIIETVNMVDVRYFLRKGYEVVEKRSPQGERLFPLYVLKLKEASDG